MRSFHTPGRSLVYGRRAMCATSHPTASLTCIEVLRQGGNAVDAAIATAAVLAVVEPHMTGIGGDCFAIVAKPGSKKLIALNASGRAPKAATAAWLAKSGLARIEPDSAHAVTVPGAISGWMRLLEDHGTWSIERLLQPAIALAQEGFVVTPRVAADWARQVVKVSRHAGARKHLLPTGQAPKAGEIMRFPALAATLKRIARDGRDGFYRAESAKDMVAELKALGGLHTLDDFAAQAESASYVTPISVPYRGVELVELPPSNHGIVALIMLKMLERVGKMPPEPGSAERYHLLMEAARLAFAMRDAFVADPDKAEVPVEHMLDDEVIANLVARLDRRKHQPRLGPLPQPVGSDTVYFSVVDEKGMGVSFINSLFDEFGSGIVTTKTGIVLHNRGKGFVTDPSHPNCIAPGKRPLHTLVPAMVLKDGKPYMAFGVMGAHFQPMGHVYVMSNMFDYGMDAQEALDAPRVFFEGDELLVEETVPDAVVTGLKRLGHRVARRAVPWGGGQIVVMDRENRVLIGASDARKDGMALGY
jgi:gamma-glutamyltranspeptidase / glutathione hydrolase